MSQPDGARPAPREDIIPVTEGTPTRTPWIWAIVVMPLVTSIVNAVTPTSAIVPADPTVVIPASGAYIAQQAILGLVYLATVAFAFLDSRELKKLGYVRPFGWAWAFLGTIVYVIGRVVVVYRRSGRGLEVLWVFLAVLAVSFVITAIKLTEVVGVLLQQVGP